MASSRTKTVFFAGAAISASFLIARFIEAPGLVEPLWKSAGIVVLGFFAALSGTWLAAAAFFASSSGDFFLELKPQMLIAGMASFALAHFFFIGAFALRMKKGGIRTKNWPLAAGVIAASTAMLIWLWPDMAELAIPVTGYHTVLTAMVVAAMLAPVSRWAPIGAVAFLVSDAVIGLGMFKGAEQVLAFNWPLYAGAQIMLAHGLTKRPP